MALLELERTAVQPNRLCSDSLLQIDDSPCSSAYPSIDARLAGRDMRNWIQEQMLTIDGTDPVGLDRRQVSRLLPRPEPERQATGCRNAADPAGRLSGRAGLAAPASRFQAVPQMARQGQQAEPGCRMAQGQGLPREHQDRPLDSA